MNPQNVVIVLADLVKTNLDLHSPSKVTTKEREIAQHSMKF
jgi:hypothetical protein